MSWAFNASNIPVEAQEANQPIVVERFELTPDSAGAGKFRGGCGVRRDLRFAEVGMWVPRDGYCGSSLVSN